MSINKQIPADQWVEFFDTFTNGNRGRLIDLEVVDREVGDETLVKERPLLSLIYDPVNKGNDLTIEIGREQVSYGHTIDAPKEVWQEQDDKGNVVALEIKADDENQAIVRLL
ncbi:MAG TPA: DUF5335 family protein [Waterburya sp.]|jgi:hypothetical protein